MKSSGIGGQAVLEGVMMRNKSEYAVAVRKPDGEIVVDNKKCKSNADRGIFFRLPLIRGVVAFVDSLYLGMKTLAYSAQFYEDEEPGNGKKPAQGNLTDAGKKAASKKEKESSEAKNDSKEQIEMVLTVVLSVILALAIFVALPFGLSVLLQRKVHSMVLLALIEGIIRVALFIGYVCAISFMEDIHRVFMYHGAEHKTINCVENCEELTVANVRRQSRHHRRCGTSFLFVVMFLSIIFFMFLHFENMWMRMFSRLVLIPVVAGVSYEFILWAGNSDAQVVEILSKPGMWLQRLTTREPDDSMIEVAIASVEAVFDWKSYQSRMLAMEESRKRRLQRQGKRPAEQENEPEIKMTEEMRKREEEDAKRANDRDKQIREREMREAKEQRQASKAAGRRMELESLNQTSADMEDGELGSLDHFFDKENSDGKNKPSVDSEE
ncbi:MAG: DUF1385 domain-containing protein [Lachnospiraceae bacterium]|nr:DUF1385 domain-containing protein [Lachnospiraceae bacterium]